MQNYRLLEQLEFALWVNIVRGRSSDTGALSLLLKKITNQNLQQIIAIWLSELFVRKTSGANDTACSITYSHSPGVRSRYGYDKHFQSLSR